MEKFAMNLKQGRNYVKKYGRVWKGLSKEETDIEGYIG